MSGFSGGGGSVSATVAWDPSVTGHACAQLQEARARTLDAASALAAAPDLRVVAVPGVHAADLARCGAWLDDCTAQVRALAADLELLRSLAELAGRSYEWASDAVRTVIEEVAGSVAYALGTAVRASVIAVAPWVVGIALVAVPVAAKLVLTNPHLLQRVLHTSSWVGRFLEDTSAIWARVGEALMANPAFTAALALALESSDEALAGLLGIPAPLAAAVERTVGDDEIMGLLALGGAGLAGAASGGGRVEAAFRRPIPPLDAPLADEHDAMRVILEQDEQVTIHTFRMEDGSVRHQVFVRGTQTILPSGASGLDMRANLENAGAVGADLEGSDAAVAEAMRAAGIQPGEPVDLFGFSQGAGAVANVAASGEFAVETAMLIGGPVASAEIGPEVAVLSVAHHGDIVPPLDGWGDAPSVHTTMLTSAGGQGTGPLARHAGLEYLASLERLDDFVADAYRARLSAATAGGVGIAGTSVHLRRR